MKNTHCRKKDNSIWILVILCCFALVSVVGAFKINYDKVHQLILNNEVEQLSFTTRYLSRLLERVILCCFALVSVVGAFKINYDKVHQLILNNEVEQLSFTTRYLSRLLEREIESQVDLLTSIAKVFTYYQKEDINGVVGRLESYQREMNYHIMGLSDLQGAVIDGNGNHCKVLLLMGMGINIG